MLLALAAATAAGGCFSPSFQPCQLACGSGGACPQGMSCEADNMCHASSAEPQCTQLPDAATPADAPMSLPDARMLADARMLDAGPDAATPADAIVIDGGRPDGDGGSSQIPAPGDVIVTEIMNNPCAPSGGICAVLDSEGEWFELHNTTSKNLDLDGLVVHDNGSPPQAFVIGGSLPIPAGGNVVLGNNADVSTNGGVTVDYQYPSSFILGNSADEIVLQLPAGGAIIDEVDYTTLFPGGKGIAMSLNPADYDALANDSAQSWCDASTLMSDGDFGTPGLQNPPCP